MRTSEPITQKPVSAHSETANGLSPLLPAFTSARQTQTTSADLSTFLSPIPPSAPIARIPLAAVIQRVQQNPRSLTRADIALLHRTVGNQAVGRLLTAAQSRQAVASPEPTPSEAGFVNTTGLLDRLKAGVEDLSGVSLEDVKVHYNSARPAQVQAEAYAQGTDIHLALGQERHLPHEAWHVVQQKQGRGQPTMQLKGGAAVNDDSGLEQEADVMGVRTLALSAQSQDIPQQAELQRNILGMASFQLKSISISSDNSVIFRPVVQRRLIVAQKTIPAHQVESDLESHLKGPPSAVTKDVLKDQAKDSNATFTYANWDEAINYAYLHPISEGNFTFTNVNAIKKYRDKAKTILVLLNGHDEIRDFVGDSRRCFITLTDDRSDPNPATVDAVPGRDRVDISMAIWYFENYSIGYILGLLSHEFGVHPIASAKGSVTLEETGEMNNEHKVPSNVSSNKKLTVNADRAEKRAWPPGQADHIFAALWDKQRSKVYQSVVTDMAKLLAKEVEDHKLQKTEITDLCDSFLMDLATILAANDNRIESAKQPGLVAEIYNAYRKKIIASINNSDAIGKLIVSSIPPPTTKLRVVGKYFDAVKNISGNRVKNTLFGWITDSSKSVFSS